MRFGTHFLGIYEGLRHDVYRHVFEKELEDQDLFIRSDRGVAMLIFILSKLQAVKRIELGEWCKIGKLFEIGWGGRRFEEALEQSLCPFFYSDADEDDLTENLTYTLNRVLTALSVTKQPIEHFEAFLRNDTERGGNELRGVEVAMVSLQPLSGPPRASYSAGLKSAFRSLKTLRLALEYKKAGHDTEKSNPAQEGWLASLICLAPSLERLSLFFDQLGLDDDWPAKNRFAFSRFAATAYMPNTAYSELANGVVQPSDFARLFRNHKRLLRELVLRRIALNGYIGGRCLSSPWLIVLQELKNSPSLQSVTLSCLYNDHHNAVAFTLAGLEDCTICQSPWQHCHGSYIQTDCEHVSWQSDHGPLPLSMSSFEIDIEIRNTSHPSPIIRGWFGG